MTEPLSPFQIAQSLIQTSETVNDAALQQQMREGAETVIYLLTLLNECANYIEDVKEYNLPPRFIIAVRDALERP